jgi:predicted tellurium resistance membrane protein TerC
MGLTRSLFSIADFDVTGRSLILIGGGLFLLVKSTREIHNKLENVDRHPAPALRPSFASALVQIVCSTSFSHLIL